MAARGWKATARDADVRVAAPASQATEVNRAAAEAGITLRALRPREASLEEIFLRMTGGSSNDNGRPFEAAVGDDARPAETDGGDAQTTGTSEVSS